MLAPTVRPTLAAKTNPTMNTDVASDRPRPHLVQLEIPNIATLHAVYMPLLQRGGLFVPTTREYALGDSIYVLLTLPNSSQRHPFVGEVAWITPAHAGDGRQQGVGVQFPDDARSAQLKDEIEKMLGTFTGPRPLSQTV